MYLRPRTCRRGLLVSEGFRTLQVHVTARDLSITSSLLLRSHVSHLSKLVRPSLPYLALSQRHIPT